jgi:putative transposase
MKTYKYRLYPTKQQIKMLQWTLDRCRELYNAALQERKEAWRMCHVSIGFYDQDKQLSEVRKDREEYQDIHFEVSRDVLQRVDRAYKNFFRRVKNGEKPGYPRFQSAGRYDSFTYLQGRGFSLAQDNRLCLSKIGSIKIKMHRQLQGKVKTCTINREKLYWYVTFSCKVTQEQCTPYTDEAVGIDLGLYHFAALTSGDLIENKRHYHNAEKRLIKAQHIVSRRKLRSHRRQKAIQRLAKHHRKVRNQRQDFLHQWSRRLVNTYETIVFEDLEPLKMSKRPKAKQDEETGQYLPNGASRKAGLNKSILDAGWSTFITFCQYKAEEAGTVQVIKVDPYKTSQVCSGCLHEGPHKDLSERVHTCEHCGLVLDRDVNAACNILAVAQGLNLRPAKKKRSKVARTEPSASLS